LENIIGRANRFVSTFLTFDNVFYAAECEKMVKQTAGQRHSFAQTEELTDLSLAFADPQTAPVNTRVSTLTNNPANDWIRERILNVAKMTNENYFNFDISGQEAVHLLEFGENSQAGWLDDLGKGIKSTRKLTIIIFLSERKDYSGGQLSFKLLESYNVADVPQKQGSLLVFPSYLPYKIEPLSQGRNFILLTWITGNAFV
jgi:predicted 2-oxoglutarate/Fe(II)-dependent dioxygenase YbiX